MDESCSEMNNDWSPVMQRLKLLESQLESNDEVLHEMERSLKSKVSTVPYFLEHLYLCHLKGEGEGPSKIIIIAWIL